MSPPALARVVAAAAVLLVASAARIHHAPDLPRLASLLRQQNPQLRVGDGLTFAICASVDDCRRGRACLSPESATPSVCGAGDTCFCLPTEPELCNASADCMEGETCASIDQSIPICISTEVVEDTDTLVGNVAPVGPVPSDSQDGDSDEIGDEEPSDAPIATDEDAADAPVTTDDAMPPMATDEADGNGNDIGNGNGNDDTPVETDDGPSQGAVGGGRPPRGPTPPTTSDGDDDSEDVMETSEAGTGAADDSPSREPPTVIGGGTGGQDGQDGQDGDDVDGPQVTATPQPESVGGGVAPGAQGEDDVEGTTEGDGSVDDGTLTPIGGVGESPDGFFPSETDVEIAEASPEEDDDVCFPGSARVHMADGSKMAMRDIEGGHEVMHNERGESSAVFLFTHRAAAHKGWFVRLATEAGHSVTMTGSHYVYANGVLTSADSVSEGDVLRTVSGESKVASVKRVRASGLYAPHSMHGDLVVDGIVVSGYSRAVRPGVAHAILAPVRWFVQKTGVKEPVGSLFYNGGRGFEKVMPKGRARY